MQFGPLLGPSTNGFDPMKGPMTTQTLRGLKDLPPLHWRGDMQDFQHFNGAFASLMGLQGFCEVSLQACVRHSDCPSGQLCLGISPTDMDAYTDFIMTVKFPPNPYDNLNDTLPTSLPVPLQTGGGVMSTGNPQNGRTGYINQLFDAGAISCNGCHTLPTGSNRKLFNGSAEQETQDFKIPQLRNMYEKIGFDLIRPNLTNGNGTNIALPQQKRGFGFLHDGSVSLTEFLAASVFTMNAQQAARPVRVHARLPYRDAAGRRTSGDLDHGEPGRRADDRRDQRVDEPRRSAGTATSSPRASSEE